MAAPTQNLPQKYKTDLEGHREILAQYAMRGYDVDRLIRQGLLAAYRNPKLYQCTSASIIACLITCAQHGLDPSGGFRGEAYLVPFKNEAVLIPGYKGLKKLVCLHPDVSHMEAHAVFNDDEFSFEFGLDPKLRHVPKGEPTPQNLSHAYAIIYLANGHRQFDVMTRCEIEAIRKRSRAANEGPWITDYVAMAIKTVVRRACKLAPLSDGAADLMEHDAEYGGVLTNFEDVNQAQPAIPLGGHYSAKQKPTRKTAPDSVMGRQDDRPLFSDEKSIITPKEPAPEEAELERMSSVAYARELMESASVQETAFLESNTEKIGRAYVDLEEMPADALVKVLEILTAEEGQP